jgi:hypothetical protein
LFHPNSPSAPLDSMQPILIPAHHAACELMQRACQPEVAERRPECTIQLFHARKPGAPWAARSIAVHPRLAIIGAPGCSFMSRPRAHERPIHGRPGSHLPCRVDYFVPLPTGTWALRKVSSSRSIVTRADSALS